MPRLLLLTSSLMLALSCVTVQAVENVTEDGLKQGDPIGAFRVIKVAGADDDGVEPGDDLCYRCRYGSSPMVMIFARDTGGKLAEFVKQLDAAVARNEERRLRGLLTLIGDTPSNLKEQATHFAEHAGAKRVPVVVAKESKDGPMGYRLSDAAVTVVIAQDSQVVNTHAFAADSIDISKVMKDVDQILQ